MVKENSLELYKTAIECILSNRTDGINKAEDSLEELLDQDKDGELKEFPNIYRWLGTIYFERENYIRANEYFQEALEKAQKKDFKDFRLKVAEDKNALASTYHDLGLVLTEQKCYLDAQSKLNKAIEIIKEDNVVLSQFLNDLGYLYYIWGKYFESIEQYEKVIKMEKEQYKNNLNKKNGYTEIYRGLALYEIGYIDKARESFDDALIIFEHKAGNERDLSEAAIKNNLARIYIDKELYEKAEPLIKDALGIYENENQKKYIESNTPRRKKIEKETKIALLINYGILYYNQGINDEAKEKFNQAIKYSEKTSYRAYYNLANVYARDGDLNKAEENYKKALELKPERKEAKDAIERLKEAKKEKIDWWEWWFKPLKCDLKFTIPLIKKNINGQRPTFKGIFGIVLIIALLLLIATMAVPSTLMPSLNKSTTEQTVTTINNTKQTSDTQKNTTTKTTTETNPIGSDTKLLCAALIVFLLIFKQIKSFSVKEGKFEMVEPEAASKGSAPQQAQKPL